MGRAGPDSAVCTLGKQSWLDSKAYTRARASQTTGRVSLSLWLR
jgi:hypothetical protein